MERITLNYDRDTGDLYGANGSSFATYLGLIGLPPEKDKDASLPIQEVAYLKKAGFSSDEIIDLRKNKVV